MRADGEIALYFENGTYKALLITGRYAFWKGYTQKEFIKADLSKVNITEKIPVNLLENMALKPFTRKFQVLPFEKGLLYVNGSFVKELTAGTYYFWKNSTSIVISRADLRTMQMEIAGQEILTKDKAALRINFYLQYNITDIVKAVVNNKEYDKQLYVLMQLALREFVGALTLDELVEKKENVSDFINESVAKRAEALGRNQGLGPAGRV